MRDLRWRDAVAAWWRSHDGEGRARLVARVALALVALALVLFLLQGDKPWECGAETRADPAVKHFVVSGLWWGAAANVLLSLVLLAAVPLWVRRLPAAAAGAGAGKSAWGGGMRSGPFLSLVAGALLLGVLSAAPRLGLSLWGDEEHTLRTYVLGSYQWSAAGELEFRPVNWQRSLWGYVNPNNHVLNTVLARLSLGLWSGCGREAGGLPFSEAALRFPAFVAALGGIGAGAWMLRRLGFARAGVVSAYLCVLHPWYLRYSSESRGYAFLLLFLPVAVFFLVDGVERGRARSWAGFAAAEFLLLWSYPGAAHFLALANLAALVGIGCCHGLGARAWVLAGRWGAANALAGMAFLQVYAPCIPQLIRYTRGARAQAGTMDGSWLLDMLGHMFGGMPWHWADPTNRIAVSVERVLADQPAAWAMVGALPLLALVGFGTFALRGRLVSVMGWAFALAGPLMYLQARAIHNYLYHAHMIFTLPLAICFVATGIDSIARRLSGGRGRGAGAVAACLLTAYGVVTFPQRCALRKYPIEAQRESVLATRSALGPGAPDVRRVITLGLRRGGSHLMTVPSYDVAARYVGDARDLRMWMERAAVQSLPLYVNLAMPTLARIGYPDVMNLVDDERLFRLEAEFPGLEPNTTRYVYRRLDARERSGPGALSSPR